MELKTGTVLNHLNKIKTALRTIKKNSKTELKVLHFLSEDPKRREKIVDETVLSKKLKIIFGIPTLL